MNLENKSILLVIAPDQFHDDEVKEPIASFEADGAKVTTVSTKAGTAKGMFEYEIEVKETFTSVKSSDYDAIVVIGGQGARRHLWESQALRSLVKEFNDEKKLVASICVAGVILAKAGVLKGKKATVYNTSETLEIFTKNEVEYVPEEFVVIDGNTITANGPSATKDFITAVTKALAPTPVAV